MSATAQIGWAASGSGWTLLAADELIIKPVVQAALTARVRTVTVTNKFAVPVVVHSVQIPPHAAKFFTTAKFEPRVGVTLSPASHGTNVTPYVPPGP
jgi:hypothetical protein